MGKREVSGIRRVWIAVALGQLACGGGAASTGAASAGTGGKNSGGTGSSSGSGTGGSSSGNGGTTNMPGVTLTGSGGEIVTGDSGTDVVGEGPAWLEVTSSHYYVHSREDDPFFEERWLARIENIGPSTVCGILVRPTFYDAQGREVLSLFGASVYGPLYNRPADTAPRLCIEPGGFGIALGSSTSDELFDVSRVAEVVYSVSGSTYEDLTPSVWVTERDLRLDGKVVRGTLTSGDQELGWWHVYVFAEGEGHVPVASQDLSDGLTGIAPGYSWSFETAPFDVPMTDFEVFVDHSVRL